MGRLDFLYRMERPHRAKLVYLYLYDRQDKEKSMAGAEHDSEGLVRLTQHGQAGSQGSGKSRADTKRAALPGQRERDLQSIFPAIQITLTPKGAVCPNGEPSPGLPWLTLSLPL